MKSAAALICIGLCGTAAAAPLEGKVILVDAGHGVLNLRGDVINGGKQTPSGTPEHALTLTIAEKVADRLRSGGAKVYLTRTRDDYWRLSYNSVDDNRARAVLANAVKADSLVSIHCDWHPNRSIQGVTTLYASSKSYKLGAAIQSRLVSRLGAKDRKVKRDNFTILDGATMPAVIVETGFMSHGSEGKRLMTPGYQDRVAAAIADGILAYLGPG